MSKAKRVTVKTLSGLAEKYGLKVTNVNQDAHPYVIFSGMKKVGDRMDLVSFNIPGKLSDHSAEEWDVLIKKQAARKGNRIYTPTVN